MTEGFNLDAVKDLYLHNAGNDAVVTLVVALRAGLNDGMYGTAEEFCGFPSNEIQGRSTRETGRWAGLKLEALISGLTMIRTRS
jgi:hypothetical protein